MAHFLLLMAIINRRRSVQRPSLSESSFSLTAGASLAAALFSNSSCVVYRRNQIGRQARG